MNHSNILASILFLATTGAYFLGYVWYFQENFLFYPTYYNGCTTPNDNPVSLRHPAERGMVYEDIYLKTKNAKLHLWFIKQKGEKYKTANTIIFFPGRAGNIGWNMPYLTELYRQCNVNILALSYRGYGFSTGKTTEDGIYDDAEASLDYLLKKDDIDKNKIFLLGTSLGGAVSIDLASRRQQDIRGVIIENTFTSILDALVTLYPFLNVARPLIKLIQRIKMNNLEKVPAIKIPSLFISSQADELIPPSRMQTLFDACGAKPKKLLSIEDGNHCYPWDADVNKYCNGINSFMQSTIDGTYSLLDSLISTNASYGSSSSTNASYSSSSSTNASSTDIASSDASSAVESLNFRARANTK